MRTVLNSFEQATDRAQKKVSAGAKKSAKDQASAAQEGVKATEQAEGARTAAVSRAEAIRQRIRDNTLRKQQAEEDRADRKRTADMERNERIRARIRDATFRKQQADEERSERQSQNVAQSRRRTWGRDFGRSAVGNMGGMARTVMGGVGEVARGAGIDPSLGGLTARVMAAEGAAMRATLSGFAAKNAKARIKGEKTEVATSGDIQSTLQATRAAGDATAISYGDMASGLEAFVSKSGDLQLGKDMLLDIGKIAQATGSNFVELADAAGDISNGLGDMPAAEKIKKMGDALRLVATQGSMGTVEIKDMATLMARLVSPATRTSSDFQVGLSEAGAIAQMSRMGGATTAAEQTMSATAFTRDLTKKANLKRYEEQGFNVFANKEHTQIRGIQDIIVDVFKKTNGDLGKITELFPNEASKRAVMGMHGTYMDAGGGEAGILAIQKKFQEFSASMSQEDVDNAAGLAKRSKAGQAQSMQNKFETSWADALEKVAPAMERMAPHIGKVADGFASLVVFMAENPGKAVVGAIVASIGKAAIGTAVSSALAKWVEGSAAGGAAGAGPAKAAGGAAGVFGAASLVAVGAVTITAIGVELIADEFKRRDAKDSEEIVKRQEAQVLADNAVSMVQRGAISPEDAIAQLETQRAELEAKIKSGENAPGLLEGNVRALRDSFNWVAGSGPSFDATRTDTDNARHLEANKDAINNVAKTIAALKNGVQQVSVVNMPAGGLAPGIKADGSGTTGPTPIEHASE